MLACRGEEASPILTLRMKTLVYETCGETVIFVCGEIPLDDREWNEYVAFLARHFKPGRKNRSLVLAPSAGAQPTSLQRGRLNDVLTKLKAEGAELKSAILTNSPLVRGVITALQWFNRDVFRTFPPGELRAALSFLDLQGARAADTETVLRRLERELRMSATA